METKEYTRKVGETMMLFRDDEQILLFKLSSPLSFSDTYRNFKYKNHAIAFPEDKFVVGSHGFIFFELTCFGFG